ncbi:MAG: hypothetical protein EZS28_017068 [Streblomastix strix]|uniref:Uncharacterized protein n=1 Tax=Streblomastix strix TaxID=222440 RepID=A0A5J4VYR3_9EUKA|nr:MAG: hypothetical protein EZS28_017068 [Streblomastix strix]
MAQPLSLNIQAILKAHQERKFSLQLHLKKEQLMKTLKIVHINHHVWDAYVTEIGHVIITRGMYKEAKEFVTELTTPQKVLQLPFFMDELHCLILTKKTHFTALRADGDATDYVIQLAKSNIQESDMRIKHFAHVAMSFYFLFE